MKKVILILSLLLTLFSCAYAQGGMQPAPTRTLTAAGITLDTTSNVIFTGNSSFSWSHTPSGTNRYLVVDIVGGDTVTGVTFNSVAMTSLGTATSSDGYIVSKWGLIAPATGAHNIVATVSGPPSVFAAAGSSWNGVNQTTPTGTVATAVLTVGVTTISVNASSASGEVVVDGTFVYNRTITPDGTQTQMVNIINTDDNVRLGTSYKSGSGTTTMQWTWSVNQDRGAIVAIALKP